MRVGTSTERQRKLKSVQLFYKIKLTTILLLISFLQVNAAGYGQVKINLQLKETSIQKILKEVEKQTSYRFVYHTATLPQNKKVDISARNADLEEVLNQALSGTSLAYQLKEDNLVVIFASENISTVAEDKIIRGKITDAGNQPLAGVSVKVAEQNIGTVTNSDGSYSLKIPSAAKVLEISALGYLDQQINIDNRQVIDIKMEQDIKVLNNVVVTGYTSYSRSKSVASASVVGADKINDVPMSTFDQVLQGRVPGLVVSSVSGQPGTSANVTLRGVGTINGSSSVLYVVDGVPIESGYFQTINPADIETVTVLKDASAKAQYGSRGSNGVIVVTTKKGKAGKLTVQYNSQYGFSNRTSPRFKMMNAEEHLKFEEEIGLETGSNIGPGWEYSKLNPDYADLTPEEQRMADHILDSLRSHNTDWRKIFFRTGKFMEQQVSASGGNENVRFYNSLNYYNETGIAVRSELQRFTLKSNVDFNFGKLTANMNVNLGYSNSSFIPREGSSNGRNPLSAVYYALPYEYPYAPDGTLVNYDLTDEYPVLDEREGSNSLEYLVNTSSKTNQYKTIISTSLNYNISSALVAKTRLGVDFRESVDQDFIKPDSYYGRRVSSGEQGSFGEGLRRNFYLISTSGLSFSKLINQRHDVEVSGYFEYSTNNYKSFNYTGYGIEPRLPETPAGITPGSDENGFIANVGGRRTKNVLTSYMAFGRYTLDDKYTLNLNYRYDGFFHCSTKQSLAWILFRRIGMGSFKRTFYGACGVHSSTSASRKLWYYSQSFPG